MASFFLLILELISLPATFFFCEFWTDCTITSLFLHNKVYILDGMIYSKVCLCNGKQLFTL